MFDFYNTRNEKAFIVEYRKLLVHYTLLLLLLMYHYYCYYIIRGQIRHGVMETEK